MPGNNNNEEAHLGVLPLNWERAETQEGIPYYKNHSNGRTQWEHPVLTELFKELRTLDVIRPAYGAYRVASKLRTLQVITNLHKVSKENVWKSLKDMNLTDQMESNLSVSEIETLFAKIFYKTCEQNKMEEVEAEASIEISLSWALKCYDSGRTGCVLLRSLFAGLLVLTTSSIIRKYKDLFKLYAMNGHMTDEKLALLLSDVLLLIDTIDEQEMFNGDDIPGTIASLKSLFQNGEDISEGRFIEWLKKEPQLIVWLPTLHRFVTAETVKHEAKCAGCKMYPIVGFRYRCLKCLNVDLCQNCYWTEMGTKSHKVSHPIREYCVASTTTDDMKDFGSQMRNKITKRYRRKRKNYYLPKEVIEGEPIESHSNDVHRRIADLVTQLCDSVAPPPPLPTAVPEFTAVRVHHHHHHEPIIEEDENEITAERVTELEAENRSLRERLSIANSASTEYRSHATMSPGPILTMDTGELVYARPLQPTSTPMTGASYVTLDDYTLTPGAEEDGLRELSALMVQAIPSSQEALSIAIPTEHTPSNQGLFSAAKEVDLTLAALLYELNR